MNNLKSQIKALKNMVQITVERNEAPSAFNHIQGTIKFWILF